MRKIEKLQRDINRVSVKRERDKLQTEKDGWSKNKREREKLQRQ
jgi:hypothetical protein